MGVSDARVTNAEDDFLPTYFHVGSGPGSGKLFKLCMEKA